jgi:hypothetical protein
VVVSVVQLRATGLRIMSERTDMRRRSAARFLQLARETRDPERKARLVAMAEAILARAQQQQRCNHCPQTTIKLRRWLAAMAWTLYWVHVTFRPVVPENSIRLG